MKSIDPKQRYAALKEKYQLIDDMQQQQLIDTITDFYYNLTKKKNIFSRFTKNIITSPGGLSKQQGFYVWGPSGIGKTLVMDCFYSCLEPNTRLRQHSIQFIQHIHQRLIKLQGHDNPLQLIAAEIINKTTILCLDEFQIINVADLMLWRNLLKYLLCGNIHLFITSNNPPKECYKGYDEQQQRLAPLASDLTKNLNVIHMLNHIDYRKKTINNKNNTNNHGYFICNTHAKKSAVILENFFIKHTAGHPISEKSITVHNRPIQIIKQAGDTIWFSFTAICSIPRCYRDYLWLAEKYRVFIISDLHQLKRSDRAKLINFIALIDVLTDNNNLMIISSSIPIDELYKADHPPFALKRLLSRLYALCPEASDI